MGYGSTRSMRQRALTIVILIVLLFGASGINLIKYMLVNSSFYQKKATMQQLQDTEISAKRGDIYDRNMEVLATSATAYTVYITPQDIKSDDTAKLIAKGLSELLDVEYDKVYDMLHLNPGAAGCYGFHKVRTALRFTIDGSDIKDMEFCEWPRG